MFKYLSYWFQCVLPQKLLSQLFGTISHIKIKWIKNILIFCYVKANKISFEETVKNNPYDYDSLHALFIRKLKSDARKINSGENNIISPSDGTITSFGLINDETQIIAKNHSYDISTLIGEKDYKITNGGFLSVYLAPGDYHCFHMPITGKITSITYIPGKLFSVNPSIYKQLPSIFTTNERVIVNIETQSGSIIMVLIGAFFVGSINLEWHGPVNNKKTLTPITYVYEEGIDKKQGEELGFFAFGSSIILLPQSNNFNWNETLTNDQKIEFGQLLGYL